MKKTIKAKKASAPRGAKGVAKKKKTTTAARAASTGRAGRAPKSEKAAKGSGKAPRAAAAPPAAKKEPSRGKAAVPKTQRAPKSPASVPTAPAKKKSRGSKKPPPSRAVLVAQRRKSFGRYRDLLLEKHSEQIHAYTSSKEDTEISLDNGTEDYIDYAVNSYARDFLLSLTELDRKQLLQIEDALRRIDRGEYGRCQQCGEAINPKRLDVQPWARHCVKCQELEEQGLLPQYPASAVAEDYEEEELEAPAEVESGDEVEDDASPGDDSEDEGIAGAGLSDDAEDSEE